MYIEQSLKKYLDDLGAKLPAPGGGSASALVGAVGISLLEMVGNFTIGKEKYKEFEKELKEILDRLKKIRTRLQELIDEDVKVYRKVSEAYKIPKEDFQLSLPPGDEIPVEFTAGGIDRTDIFKGPDPDYAKLVQRWKSVTGNRSAGMGPHRINSPSHGVGVSFEHYLLSRGIIGYENNDVVNWPRLSA